MLVPRARLPAGAFIVDPIIIQLLLPPSNSIRPRDGDRLGSATGSPLPSFLPFFLPRTIPYVPDTNSYTVTAARRHSLAESQ